MHIVCLGRAGWCCSALACRGEEAEQGRDSSKSRRQDGTVKAGLSYELLHDVGLVAGHLW